MTRQNTTPPTEPIGPPLPSDQQAEASTLGSVVMNRDALLAVSSWLTPADFHVEQYAWIYQGMLDCLEQRTPPDMTTITDRMAARGHLINDSRQDTMSMIMGLVEVVPSSFHIVSYAQIVQRCAILRRVISAGGAIASKGYAAANDTTELDALVEQLHSLVDAVAPHVASSKWNPTSLAQLWKKELPPLRWVVPGLIPVGVTLLVGAPKMKKSWLAYGLGIATALGGYALGKYAVEQGTVLYLALEDGERRVKSRGELMLGERAAPDNFYYVTEAPRLNAGGAARLEGWMREHPDTRLIIIDVLEKVRPQRRNNGSIYGDDYDAIAPLKAIAERHNVGVLIIHHRRKQEADDPMDTASGSTGITGAPDTLLVLSYERGQQDAVLYRTGRDLPDDNAIALRWDGATYQWLDIGSAEEHQKSQERQQIIDAIKDIGSDVGPRDVAEVLDKPYGNIKQLMFRMVRDGDLVNAGRGKYNIPERMPQPKKDDDEQHVEQQLVARSPRSPDNPDHLDHLDHYSKGDRSDHGDPSAITLVPSIPMQQTQKVIEVIDKMQQVNWSYIAGRFKADDMPAIRVHCAILGVDVERVLEQVQAAIDHL